MKKILLGAALALTTSAAWATVPQDVPEMSAGAGIAAIALLAGLAVIIREKTKK